MHLHFTTLCAAIAACRVSGSHAAPSRSIAKLLHPLPEVPTNKRHLRSNKHALDEEERGELTIDLNKTPDEVAKGIEELMGIIGEPSAEQHKLQEEEEAQSKLQEEEEAQSKLLKEQEEKEAELKLLKEQEEKEAQFKLLKEQEENEAQLKLLKEQEKKEAQVKLLKAQEAQAKLQDEFKKLNDWNEISASFTSQLKEPKGEEFKKLKEGGTYDAKQTVAELHSSLARGRLSAGSLLVREN